MKFMKKQLCFYISVCIHISGYTCAYMFVGLEICMSVPLPLQLSVYLCSFVVLYYLGQKPCLIQLDVSSGECSISQILMFAGLNEWGWQWISLWMYPYNVSYLYIGVEVFFWVSVIRVFQWVRKGKLLSECWAEEGVMERGSQRK